jgi:hypothetical protein
MGCVISVLTILCGPIRNGQDCVNAGVITPDDLVVYRDTYPVFDPAYITYEYTETAFREKMNSFLETTFQQVVTLLSLLSDAATGHGGILRPSY